MRARNPSVDVSDHRLVAVVRRLVAGFGAGVLAGAIVGGVLGRLAMALLRVTSSQAVIGATSDDGFEIGRVSLQSLQLVALTGIGGGLAGVVYTVFGPAVRQTRLRIVLWTVMGGAAGGAVIVHSDGVDFTLLGPAWLAVSLFVLLPALGAFAVARLAERWAGIEAASAARGHPGSVSPRHLVPLAACAVTVAGLVDLIVDIAAIT
jgi:hypothetical protein